MRIGKTACVGIEIQDDCVRAVEVIKSNRNVQISRTVEIPLEPGLVVDGDIQQPEELGFLIREQFKLNDIKTKIARVVVPSRYIVIRQISMPKISKKDIRQAIEFELQHNIHLPFDDHVFDFVKLPIQNKDTIVHDEIAVAEESAVAETQEPYIVVAAARDVVERIVDTLEIASLKVITVDIRALALFRLYKFTQEQALPEQTLVIVEISETGTDIHIFRDSFLLFTRNVPLAFFNYRKENFTSFAVDAAELADGNPLSSFDTKLFAQDLVYEIERSINFYQYSLNNRDQYVSHVILSGNVVEFETFQEIFKSRLDFQVGMITANQITWKDETFGTGAFQTHAVATGLAIREEKRTWK